MDNFFDNPRSELSLDFRIANIFSQGYSPINSYRAVAEKVNFITNFLPQMEKFHFKICNEIIDVATHNYSFLFFPDLTHMDYSSYILEYENLYSTIFASLTCDRKLSILDIGCGICDLAAFLADKNIFYCYHAIDKNPYVIASNRHYYHIPGLTYVCTDIFDHTIDYPVDYIFLFNIVKHLYHGDVMRLIKKIFDSSPHAVILVQDVEPTINKLLDACKQASYQCYFQNRILYICLYERGQRFYDS